ncbi:hypothetical protein QTP88_026228 [Uroleucon formosanum]
MVKKCCVAGCLQKYIKGLSLFKVPFHDVERSEKWMNMIGINETKNKNYFVCEKHFKSCDFDHNKIGVNIKKLKSSAIIEIVNVENEHKHNNMELSFEFEEIEFNDDNSDENEMNDSICNEKSPIKINHINPKILFHQSLNSNQESLCDYCNRRHNILKAREYHLKKLAEIKEEESKLPLSCPCGNMENLKSNKQCMTPLDECNKNVATLTPKALARHKGTLALEALKKLYEIDIQVPSLTFDGPASYFSMAHSLGANLSITNTTTFFPHPCDPTKFVNCIIDPCHALKLVRNAWFSMRVIYDGFEDSEATTQFIRTVDKWFDILNSINPHGCGYKSLLRSTNIDQRTKELDIITNYILKIT